MVKVVRTQHFHYCGPWFDPWLGNVRSLKPGSAAKIKNNHLESFYNFINANVPALIPEMMADAGVHAKQPFKGSLGECQGLSGMRMTNLDPNFLKGHLEEMSEMN